MSAVPHEPLGAEPITIMGEPTHSKLLEALTAEQELLSGQLDQLIAMHQLILALALMDGQISEGELLAQLGPGLAQLILERASLISVGREREEADQERARTAVEAAEEDLAAQQGATEQEKPLLKLGPGGDFVREVMPSDLS